ncbi:unnamed protein product [Bursaphelenchus xylophilus]|uniref:(pine wood nematode) hypothetical protein n=1 Tax=Bursaphelenchus xylophilus TaxID=6326 RepID=A0A1I7S6U4_BURXY|nr:unnamed protein product [Bursaphelenchus xylophilus]CAG9079764.1 unnamed protein product [Bursaphelenchus xylophilus]
MSSSSSRDSLDVATPGGNVARLINRLSKDINGPPMSVPVKRESSKALARVRYSYDAAQDDELNLCENDVIEVLEDVEDGWARGKLNGRIGLFPTNFVTYTVPVANRLTYTNAIAESASERPQQFKREESEKNRPKTAQKPLSDSVTSSRSITSSNKLSSSTSSTSSTKEYGRVLYDYPAEHPDELELKEGDVVVVLNKKTADEGWYEGEINGRKGVFPENYIKLMSSNERPVEPTNPTPPVLPAKPNKPLVGAKPSNGDSGQKSPVQPSPPSNGSTSIPTKPSDLIRERQSTIQSENKAPEGPTSTSAPVKTALEERKSVVAGLQSKLFPQGKLPPHRPAFTSHSNAMTSSVHGALREEKPDIVPISRHSIMDPTRVSPEKNDEEPLVEGKTGQLEPLTKTRPKMAGKRPPSSQFRQSKLSLPLEPTAVESEEPIDSPQTPVESVAISSGPATTVFPPGPQTSTSTVRQSSPSTRPQEVQNVVKELASVTQTVKDRNSPKPTKSHSSDPITSSEFEQFRLEILGRLRCLEDKVDKLLRQEKL